MSSLPINFCQKRMNYGDNRGTLGDLLPKIKASCHALMFHFISFLFVSSQHYLHNYMTYKREK